MDMYKHGLPASTYKTRKFFSSVNNFIWRVVVLALCAAAAYFILTSEVALDWMKSLWQAIR